MFEEIIKEIIDKNDLRQQELKTMLPHFETKEDALKYAVRLANLKPGDRVKAPYGDVLEDHVFLHFDKNSAFLLKYDPDTKILRTNKVAPGQLILD